MERWIAITAVGRDRPGIVAGVTQALLNLGCNLGETSMTRLRGEFAMILLVRLPERIETAPVRQALVPVGEALDLTINVRPLSAEESSGVLESDVGASDVAYILRVYGADRPGIVHAVTSLLAAHGLNITDLETRVIPGDGGSVYVMVLELDAPTEERGEAVRKSLQTVADELGVDVSYERLDEETL